MSEFQLVKYVFAGYDKHWNMLWQVSNKITVGDAKRIWGRDR